MSYLTTKQVQVWLQSSKYHITAIEPELETAAKDYLFGEFGQRYDTSSWTNGSTTPSLVISTLSMQVASYILRRAVSQDDGLATYADWLEKRVHDICEAVVDGSLTIPGAVTDPDSSLGGGPAFYPTDASTLLADYSPNDPEASGRSFTMGMQF